MFSGLLSVHAGSPARKMPGSMATKKSFFEGNSAGAGSWPLNSIRTKLTRNEPSSPLQHTPSGSAEKFISMPRFLGRRRVKALEAENCAPYSCYYM